jgi:hypothetical protein
MGGFNHKGIDASRLCNQPQLSTTLGKASHHKLAQCASSTATIHDMHKEGTEGNTTTTMMMTMPLLPLIPSHNV